jgi:hypothetical protein
LLSSVPDASNAPSRNGKTEVQGGGGDLGEKSLEYDKNPKWDRNWVALCLKVARNPLCPDPLVICRIFEVVTFGSVKQLDERSASKVKSSQL